MFSRYNMTNWYRYHHNKCYKSISRYFQMYTFKIPVPYIFVFRLLLLWPGKIFHTKTRYHSGFYHWVYDFFGIVWGTHYINLMNFYLPYSFLLYNGVSITCIGVSHVFYKSWNQPGYTINIWIYLTTYLWLLQYQCHCFRRIQTINCHIHHSSMRDF